MQYPGTTLQYRNGWSRFHDDAIQTSVPGLSVYRCLAAGIRQRTTACERCSVLRTRPNLSYPPPPGEHCWGGQIRYCSNHFVSIKIAIFIAIFFIAIFFQKINFGQVARRRARKTRCQRRTVTRQCSTQGPPATPAVNSAVPGPSPHSFWRGYSWRPPRI